MNGRYILNRRDFISDNFAPFHKVTRSHLVRKTNKNMKHFLPSFFIMFFISMNLFSQNKIGQIAYANWNLEEEKWNYHSFDSWNYDENGREELYTYQDTRFSDFTPTNNLHSFSQYDDEGKLIEKHDLHYGPNEWRNFIYRYTYDSEGRLMEEEVTSTTSQNDVQVMYKNVFEIDDDENRKSALFYYKNEAGNYFLENRKDSIFNNQNCLIEQSFFTYFENGLIRFGRKWITAFTDECEPLQIDFYRWNTGVELLVHENKEVYDYFNDGKLITLTQEEYNDNSNQWNTRQITETELNDDGLITRYFSELYRSTGIDSTLTLTTYTSKNEVETSQKYQMRNTLEGRFFQRVRNDSFAYHYNLQDQIILREDFYQFRENSIVENTIVYKYYCNGQLRNDDSSFYAFRTRDFFPKSKSIELSISIEFVEF